MAIDTILTLEMDIGHLFTLVQVQQVAFQLGTVVHALARMKGGRVFLTLSTYFVVVL